MRSFFVSLAVVLLSSTLLAQVGQIPAWPPVQPLIGYQGPGDAVSGATGWWGFRAYTKAVAGNAAANICDSTGGIDVMCIDFLTDATSGQLVITQIGGVTCTTNCTIKTLYDQTGNSNDASLATVSLRPTFVPNCQNSQPCMSCAAGSLSNLIASALTTVSQPLSYSAVVEQTSGAGARAAWVGTAVSGNAETGFDPGAGLGYMYANGSVPTAALTTNAWHAVQTAFNGASSTFYNDGVSSTVSPGTQGIASALRLCGSANGFLSGNMGEIGMWSSAFTAGQNSSLNSNQHSFWGF